MIGIEAVGLTPYLGAFSALMVPAPWWKWTTVVSALLPVLSLVGGDFPAFFFLMVWPIIGFCAAMRVFSELEEQSEETRAELALVAERDRVARDVHDVLGHSLTALSIKAELAARLIDVDPERAREELESIQETARQALAEVRSTVGGLRAASLEAELAAAPRVLADAGIETRVVGTVADTDPRHRTLLAWVLRESVTNVVRHAHASTVSIELSPTGLVVADDGTGFEADDRPRRQRADRHARAGVRGRRHAAPLGRPGDPGGGACCRDPDPAGRRPGARPWRARGAARPRGRHRGRRPGRSRRRGGGRCALLGRPRCACSTSRCPASPASRWPSSCAPSCRPCGR